MNSLGEEAVPASELEQAQEMILGGADEPAASWKVSSSAAKVSHTDNLIDSHASDQA